MDIVVPTYEGHYEYMKKFLDTFKINCIDRDDVTINLVIAKGESKIFDKLRQEYDGLRIKLMIFSELIEKYEGTQINEIDLIRDIGKFSYQSLKKLFGALETNNKYVCIFDSECLFIRKFRMSEYIKNNVNRYVFCSRMVNKPCDDSHAKYMQNLMNEMMGTNDNNWYLELYMWIFRRDILIELKNFLEKKWGKLILYKKDSFIEYGYYLYCKMNTKKYPEIEWIDTYEILRDNMPKDSFEMWCNNTHPWCMFEHIGLHLRNATYEHLDNVNLMYKLLKIPLFRLIQCDRMNQILLILCDDIKICVSEYCPEVYEMTMKDIFNKKIGLCVGGLYRECDDVNALLNFVHPMQLDTHYYLTSQNPSIYKILVRNNLTKSLKIDNTLHPFDIGKLKHIPISKPEMVRNTMEMFYKKKTFLKYLNDYDIIINMRPDLVSFDKKLIDLVYDMLKNYDDATLYTPIMYGSLGITDTFAMGSVNVMRHNLNIYDKIYELGDKYIFNPELLTYKHNISPKTKMYPIKWQFKINWHNDQLLNAWWRHEPNLNLRPEIFDKYLLMKTNSYQVIATDFLYTRDKKYVLTNVNTGYHLYIPNENIPICTNVCVSKENKTGFYISTSGDMLHRVNITLDRNIDNLNHDGTGWNMFTVPDNTSVFGCGNDGIWAQFYLEKENKFYHIASYHTVNINNRNGEFGRYLGIENDKIVADLPKCMSTRWCIEYATF